MTFSEQNLKPQPLSRKRPVTRLGSHANPVPSWQSLASGSIPLPSLSAIDWPGAPDQATTLVATPRPSEPWYTWLGRCVPSYVGQPFADRHREVWEWVWALTPGLRPAAFIAIWPRGGGKSTTAELAVVAVCLRKARRYVLYISGTQDQADKHVATIAAMLESLGIPRALNKYGSSRGWRRNRLITEFMVIEAYGLDAATRGAKVDEARPDLLVLDDVDDRHDSLAVTNRKIETITQTLIPAGSDDVAILAVQNIIHSNSVFAQLADGRATFLARRLVSGPHPALRQMDYRMELVDGQPRAIITAGDPTWAGQSLATCQAMIYDMGPDAFLREVQHEVAKPKHQIYGAFTRATHTCPAFEVPATWQRYMGMDFGGAHTSAVLLAEEPTTKKLYLYREYLEGDLTAKEHSTALLAGEPMIPFCVGGSTSEGQWRKEFRSGGLPVNGPDVKEVSVGIDRVVATIKAGGLIIFETCTGTLGELSTYSWEPGPDGKPSGEIKNKSTYHRLDALRYIVGRIRRGQ